MIALSVNLNKIALIRNSRDTDYPSVSEFANLCIDAGADGITVHPRPDQRHIRVSDVVALAGNLAVEFNIEGNPFAGAMRANRAGVSDYPGFMELVAQAKPEQCTLVPDSDAQLTSDHGFDLRQDAERLIPVIERLHAIGCRVSLFMDPIPEQIKLAKEIGADRIELYTGPYAHAHLHQENLDTVFAQFYQAAAYAAEIGIGLNAGHDLNLDNLAQFATVPELLEVSIGHAFTVDALRYGIRETVRRYQACLGKS